MLVYFMPNQCVWFAMSALQYLKGKQGLTLLVLHYVHLCWYEICHYLLLTSLNFLVLKSGPVEFLIEQPCTKPLDDPAHVEKAEIFGCWWEKRSGNHKNGQEIYSKTISLKMPRWLSNTVCLTDTASMAKISFKLIHRHSVLKLNMTFFGQLQQTAFVCKFFICKSSKHPVRMNALKWNRHRNERL